MTTATATVQNVTEPKKSDCQRMIGYVCGKVKRAKDSFKETKKVAGLAAIGEAAVGQVEESIEASKAAIADALTALDGIDGGMRPSKETRAIYKIDDSLQNGMHIRSALHSLVPGQTEKAKKTGSTMLKAFSG